MKQLRTDLQARLDGMLAEVDRLLGGASEIQVRLRDLTATHTSGRGDVEATVGPRGILVGLRIDPRAFHSPDAVDLAAQILQASMAAAAAVTGQAQDILAEYLPQRLTAKALLGLDLDDMTGPGAPVQHGRERRHG